MKYTVNEKLTISAPIPSESEQTKGKTLGAGDIVEMSQEDAEPFVEIGLLTQGTNA